MAISLDLKKIYSETGMTLDEMLHDLRKHGRPLTLEMVKNHWSLDDKEAAPIFANLKKLSNQEKKEVKAKQPPSVKKKSTVIARTRDEKGRFIKHVPAPVIHPFQVVHQETGEIASSYHTYIQAIGDRKKRGDDYFVKGPNGKEWNRKQPEPPKPAAIPIVDLSQDKSSPAPGTPVTDAKAHKALPSAKVTAALKKKYAKEKEAEATPEEEVPETTTPAQEKPKVDKITPEILENAKLLVEKNNGKISVAALQREFGLNHNWASQLKYELKKQGVIQDKPKELATQQVDNFSPHIKKNPTRQAALQKLPKLKRPVTTYHRHRPRGSHYRYSHYHTGSFYDLHGHQQFVSELFNNNPFVQAGMMGTNLLSGIGRGVFNGVSRLLPTPRSKEEKAYDKHLKTLEKESKEQTKILKKLYLTTEKESKRKERSDEAKLDHGALGHPNLFLFRKKDRDAYEKEHGIEKPGTRHSKWGQKLDDLLVKVGKLLLVAGLKVASGGAHALEHGVLTLIKHGVKDTAKLAWGGTKALVKGGGSLVKKVGKGALVGAAGVAKKVLGWLKGKLGIAKGAMGEVGVGAEGAEAVEGVGLAAEAAEGAGAVGAGILGFEALPAIVGIVAGAGLAYAGYKAYEWFKGAKPEIGKKISKITDKAEGYIKDVVGGVENFFTSTADMFKSAMSKMNLEKFGSMINNFIEDGLKQAQDWINNNTKGGLNSTLSSVRGGVQWAYDEGKSLVENTFGLVKKNEGAPSKPYWDVDGWSYPGGLHIPGGNRNTPPPPMPKELLESKEKGKVQEAINFAASHVNPGSLNQQQLAQLGDLFYNTGTGFGTARTKWKTELFDDINKGDYAAAGERIRTLNRDVKGNIIPGISKRRDAEAAPFLAMATPLAQNQSGKQLYDSGEVARQDIKVSDAKPIVVSPVQNTTHVNGKTTMIMSGTSSRGQDDSLRMANQRNFEKP